MGRESDWRRVATFRRLLLPVVLTNHATLPKCVFLTPDESGIASGLVATLRRRLWKHTIKQHNVPQNVSPHKDVLSLTSRCATSKTYRKHNRAKAQSFDFQNIYIFAGPSRHAQHRTVVEVHPVKVVLAVVFLAVDRTAHRARNPLHHRHGVEEHLAIVIGERPNLAPHVLHSHGELGCRRFARPLAAARQRGGMPAPRVSVCFRCLVLAIRGDGALRAHPLRRRVLRKQRYYRGDQGKTRSGHGEKAYKRVETRTPPI